MKTWLNTKEVLKKRSESMKDWWSVNRDNPQTLERNKKISLNRKGILHTEETKERLRQIKKGFKHTEEAKIKMSKSRKGYIYSKEHNKKISEARKGKFLSEQTKQKLSLIRKEFWKDKNYHKQFSELRIGNNNPNWHGGIQYEPYDNNWNRKFKSLIRKRDNQICMNCGIHKEKINYSFDVHHINYDKKLSIKENCISLCHSCHSLTQTNRDYWKKIFYDKLSKLYGYKYTDNCEIIFELKLLKGGTENVI